MGIQGQNEQEPELENLDLPDRHFQVWGYTIGHRWLVLRSVLKRSAGEHPGERRRIDVLFVNVHSIKLPIQLAGLTVHVADGVLAERVLADSGPAPIYASQKVFIVEGRDYSGYVVASGFAMTKDEGDYNLPSKFWPP